MTEPDAATQTQLRNIMSSTGMSVEDFATTLEAHGSLPHGRMVALLKSEFGLTHGNANLIAHKVRERLAGGPPSAQAMLDEQYRGGKARLRPIYERLTQLAAGAGPDVTIVIQKTGVSLRRRRQFGVIQAPSAQRVQLGLNLAATPADPRVVEVTGMCSHRIDLDSVESVDDDVAAWIRRAYDEAG